MFFILEIIYIDYFANVRLLLLSKTEFYYTNERINGTYYRCVVCILS